MLKINEVFKDDLSELRAAIDDIVMEGCIDKYSQYLENKESATGIERTFLDKLNSNRVDFITKLVRKYYANKGTEATLNELMNCYEHGVYQISDRCYEDGVGDALREWFNDADVFDAIKEEMYAALDDIENGMNKTKEQQEAKELESELVQLTNTIKLNEEHTVKSKERIAIIKEKLNK